MASTTAPRSTIFRRPSQTSGWMSWFTTVDHKKIGIMYGYSAFFFFILGGLEALLLRLQLAGPDGSVLDAAEYNAMFTMHGTTMIFLFVMPVGAAFFNYMLPLLIGARDVAFPRMNALSFWIFLFGGVFLYSSFLFGTTGAPAGGNLPGGATDASWLGSTINGGWFMYQPNAGPRFSTGTVLDYGAIGLQILGLSSLIASVNFIATIFNMRAKGMKLLRMPVFAWMTTVVAFLLLFSLPIIAVALFMVTFDRQLGTLFFDTFQGGDAILWQHLFWLFGHPEVYILILPAMGIVSEVLPVFSRKPLFGYPAVVFAGAAIGFLGFGVWAHHMFAAGLGPISVAVFSVATMAIAVPTGVKIINWTLTMWGGKLWFTTAMLFAIGLIVQFTIGGLSGVTHAVAPSDTQQTDTYYIVAHFHYVIFGGAVLGLFAGIYYWWPKVFGKMLNENWGRANFWFMIIGMNMTFGPMHILGLQGQPRRMYIWTENRAGEGFFDLAFWNLVSSIGAFVLGFGALLFLVNVWVSRKNPPAPADPWDARSLEWITSSPPKEYNFARIPTVHTLDEFFHRKYEDVGDADQHDYKQVATGEEVIQLEEKLADKHIHLPSPSYWPLVLAFSFPVLAYGVIYSTLLIIAGAAIAVLALFGWALEPPTADDSEFDPPAPDGDQPSKELAVSV